MIYFQKTFSITELVIPQFPLVVDSDRPYKKPTKPNKGIKLGSYNSKSKNKAR